MKISIVRETANSVRIKLKYVGTTQVLGSEQNKVKPDVALWAGPSQGPSLEILRWNDNQGPPPPTAIQMSCSALCCLRSQSLEQCSVDAMSKNTAWSPQSNLVYAKQSQVKKQHSQEER